MLHHIKNHGTVDNEATSSKIIHGDNKHVMNHLASHGWESSIDCVIIDPPYNVKTTFKHYKDRESSDAWLSDITSTIQIIRRLLKQSGTLWVIISDHECHYLKVALDGIFGRQNFIADCAWQKMISLHNHTKYISKSYDHVLVYAKSKEHVRIRHFDRTPSMDKPYKNPDNDPRGPWKYESFTAPLLGAHGDSYPDSGGKPQFIYPIKGTSGRDIWPASGRCWKTHQSRAEEMRQEGTLHVTDKTVRQKVFLSDVRGGKTPSTFWDGATFGTNSNAKKEIVSLFGEHNIFQTPKPEELIRRIVTMATDKKQVVLDCYLGSGTTTAVCHKMERRYIGIEIGDHCKTHCIPRLIKVIGGEQGGVSKSVEWKGGGGFAEYQWNDNESHAE